jgi:hypothetical protein
MCYDASCQYYTTEKILKFLRATNNTCNLIVSLVISIYCVVGTERESLQTVNYIMIIYSVFFHECVEVETEQRLMFYCFTSRK